jgi:hypothetical protein
MADLCGDRWASRVEALAAAAGQGTSWVKIPKVTVEGVGTGADEITDQVRLPVCYSDGVVDSFNAIVSSDSDLPALSGLIGLTKNSGIVDCGNDQLIYPGPGGIKYTLSPGSRVYKLQRAISGHLLMPCAEWHKAKPNTAAFTAADSRL